MYTTEQNGLFGWKSKISRFARFTENVRIAISRTLPITKTKNQDHFLIQSTPQNMEKLTSETTFGHSKKFVVIASYKNAFFYCRILKFWILTMLIPDY